MNKSVCLSDNEYSVKVVDDLQEFEKLRDVWDTLAEKHDSYFPFLCFDWFKIWLKNFLNREQLFVLLLYYEGTIVAIAPFLIKTVRLQGLSVKAIDLIGNIYSPFRYFLFHTQDKGEMEHHLSLIVSFLRTNRRDWDLTMLNGIPEENGYFEVVRGAVKKTAMQHREFPCYGDWYLDGIEYTADQYLMNLPNKVRKDILYCKRRLQNMGNLNFKLIIDRESVDYYMNLYYEVYSRSWQKNEGIGPNFHRDFAQIASKKNWLRLGFLMFNDCPISSQFWISSNGTAFILKTTYDQNYKKYSPGKVLTMEMIRHIITVDNVRVIDYIHGDEPYKQDWTPKRRERKGLHLYNNNLKGRYLTFLNNGVLPILNKHKYLKRAKEAVANYLR